MSQLVAATIPFVVGHELTGIEVEQDLPVDASAVIFESAVVGFNATTDKARQLVAGDVFAGIALRIADNTGSGSVLNSGNIGNATAGNIPVRVRTRGHVIINTLGGAAGAATDAGTTVYALDSATFQTTNANSAVKIGTVVQWGQTNAGNNFWVVSYSSAHERAAQTT